MTSILVTIDARCEVKDPAKDKELKFALESIDLAPAEWLLIEETTLRALNKDAKAKGLAEGKLISLQEDYIARSKQLNTTMKDKFDLQKENYELKVQVYELDNPAWYASPWFWGVTGVAAGTVVGGILWSFAQGR